MDGVLFCLFILFLGFSRQEYWNGLPFPSPVDHILSEFSIIRLGWPHMAWLSFIELDKAVVHVITLVSFLRLRFSLSALWCPLLVPTVLLGFLLPWTWSICSRLIQQSASYLGHEVSPHGPATDLDMGYLLTASLPDLQCGIAPWDYTWMQSQKWQNDLCSFPRQTIQYHSNLSLCPNQ